MFPFQWIFQFVRNKHMFVVAFVFIFFFFGEPVSTWNASFHTFTNTLLCSNLVQFINNNDNEKSSSSNSSRSIVVATFDYDSYYIIYVKNILKERSIQFILNWIKFLILQVFFFFFLRSIQVKHSWNYHWTNDDDGMEWNERKACPTPSYSSIITLFHPLFFSDLLFPSFFLLSHDRKLQVQDL